MGPRRVFRMIALATGVTAHADADGDHALHSDDFFQRTGMTPMRCYHVVLACKSLKIVGGTWVAMVSLEYIRYYVVNDLNWIAAIETATASPLSLVKAFLFPFYGRLADQVSRKRLVVSSSLAFSAQVWLVLLMPSIESFVLTRAMSLISDVRNSVDNAVLRDLFSAREWESVHGGVTGIKSRMAVFSAVVMAFAVFTGMGILQLGEMGYLGLVNEYTSRRDQCEGLRHCVPRGRYSWSDDVWWQIDGTLRLLMLMGACVLSLEAIVAITLLPETLAGDGTAESVVVFLRRTWRELGRPWDNLRVLATPQLRILMAIRMLQFVVWTGGSTLFMCWYRRHQLDSFQMYSLGVSGGVTGFIMLFSVPFLVERYGDLRGIWVTSNTLILGHALSSILVPASHWFLSYATFPVFLGTASALGNFTADLLSKLVPPDVQGTFHTSKDFLWNAQKALFVWPWLGTLVFSDGLAYPLDALPIMIALVIGCAILYLTVRQLPNDPAKDILDGRALEPYWDTPYVKGGWYRRHAGKHSQAVAPEPCAALASTKDGQILSFPVAADCAAAVKDPLRPEPEAGVRAPSEMAKSPDLGEGELEVKADCSGDSGCHVSI